jgi:hypothetical protein
MQQYFIVKITLPVVTGACTINGSPGYKTPLSCSDQAGSLVTTDKVYKFTDFDGVLQESEVYKRIESISETTPELKGGLGVASRASATIIFKDFLDDPNPDAVPIVNNPSLRRQGTFFGKLNARQIMNNKKVEIEYWEFDEFLRQHTKIKSHFYYITDFKPTGSERWTLSAQDQMARANKGKTTWPPEKYESLISDISDTDTVIDITNNNGLGALTWQNARYCVIGKEVMTIEFATTITGGIRLEVIRGNAYIGTGSSNPITVPPPQSEYVRTIISEQVEHLQGDTVYFPQRYGRAYNPSTGFELIGSSVDNKIGSLISTILNASGISSSQVQMNNEFDSYLPNSEVNNLFYEPRDTAEWLEEICKTYLLDIYTDLENDIAVLSTTSAWASPTRTLVENVDFDPYLTEAERAEAFRYSRATIRYGKTNLTGGDEYTEFRRVQAATNPTLEDDLYYGDEKTKILSQTTLLGNTARDNELAQTSVIRFINRFGLLPKRTNFVMSEPQLDNLKIGQVVEVETSENQGFDGKKQRSNVQITKISPKSKIDRTFNVTALSYLPDSTLVGEETIRVFQDRDINLYILAGSPPSAVTRHFIFDGLKIGQNLEPQSIKVGSMPSGSVVNLVFLNIARLSAKGGDAGNGGNLIVRKNGLDIVEADGDDGSDGGVCLFGQSGVTVNVYLQGSVTLDSISYSLNGQLHAPGGGGGGGSSFDIEGSGSGGGGGAGIPSGLGGFGGELIGSPLTGLTKGANGDDGTFSAFGDGGGFPVNGGDGGAYGQSGANGTGVSGNSGGSGGLAGYAVQANGSTVNIYGGTNSTRYTQGRANTTGGTVNLLGSAT